MKPLSGIGKKSRHRLKTAIEGSQGLLTPVVVSQALELTRFEAARLLSRWRKGGWLKRIKRGVYLPVPLEADPEEIAIENSWPIAEEIFHPGYIGGFSAIKYWDMSEQIFEHTVYLTTKQVPSRNIIYSDIRFNLKTIKPYKVFGTKTIWYDSLKVKVSDPSKTIIDILDDPKLGGGMRSARDIFDEYWASKHKNLDLLLSYAEKMKNKTIFKRLGLLLELNALVEHHVLSSIKGQISSGYSCFDSTIDNPHVLRKWNLKIPTSWKKEYDLKKRSA